MSGRSGLALLAESVRTFSKPEGAYDISGTVTAVAPGHCVVAGLSRHARMLVKNKGSSSSSSICTGLLSSGL